MIVSSEIILLGNGMVFAHESSRNLSNERCACDFCSEVVLADLSASSETHLQLLPLKLNIVGKELCEV